MKTSMFLAAVAALGLAAPTVSAQPRVRDHRQPTTEPARQNERVPVKLDRSKRDDDRRRDHRRGDRDRDDHRRGDHRRGDRDDHRRDHRDRRDGDRPDFRRRFDGHVIISSYAPQKGKAGTAVTIRGKNFAPGTMVLVGDKQVKPTVLKDTKITFRIPKGSTGTESVRLQVPNSRRLFVVGGFEVANFDAVAERKRREAERKRAAEERWKQRQKELAKSAKERRERLAKREAELRESRERRRQERLAEIRARFRAAFLADAQTQAEMALHAQRVARLQRMLRLAEANASGALVVRIEVAIDRENQRHENRMGALESSFSMN